MNKNQEPTKEHPSSTQETKFLLPEYKQKLEAAVKSHQKDKKNGFYRKCLQQNKYQFCFQICL